MGEDDGCKWQVIYGLLNSPLLTYQAASGKTLQRYRTTMMNGDGDDADDGDGDGPPTVAPKPSSLAHVTLTRQGRDFGYWRIQSANASSTKWCFSRLHYGGYCASIFIL